MSNTRRSRTGTELSSITRRDLSILYANVDQRLQAMTSRLESTLQQTLQTSFTSLPQLQGPVPTARQDATHDSGTDGDVEMEDVEHLPVHYRRNKRRTPEDNRFSVRDILTPILSLLIAV